MLALQGSLEASTAYPRRPPASEQHHETWCTAFPPPRSRGQLDFRCVHSPCLTGQSGFAQIQVNLPAATQLTPQKWIKLTRQRQHAVTRSVFQLFSIYSVKGSCIT